MKDDSNRSLRRVNRKSRSAADRTVEVDSSAFFAEDPSPTPPPRKKPGSSAPRRSGAPAQTAAARPSAFGRILLPVQGILSAASLVQLWRTQMLPVLYLVILAALLFLLGLFIGRGTGGGPDDDGSGPDDRDDRPDRGGRDHREEREERRERRHPAPERSRPAPRIVPRQAEPVQQPAPKARDWKDFDIPLDDEPTVRPAPQPAAPDKGLLADTVDQVLADEPTPKDEEDVRTMSLEDLLKDIRSM